jgi:hypothetical protein
MSNDIRRIIEPSEPGATIGNAALRLHVSPLRRTIDFYDTAGRLHGLIVLVPIFYGAIRLYDGQPLQPWYWYMVLGTLAFAIFARRAPFLRLAPQGVSFPERNSSVYAWDQMCEAHARDGELDIVLSNGQRVTISYAKMRRSDIERVKKLVKQQFKLMAARAQAQMQDTVTAKAA